MKLKQLSNAALEVLHSDMQQALDDLRRLEAIWGFQYSDGVWDSLNNKLIRVKREIQDREQS